MPFVFVPDTLDSTLINPDIAEYQAYPREHSYMYDEPRFDQPRHRVSYPDSYLPLNPYSQSYRELPPHSDLYLRPRAQPHPGRHHVRVHSPHRSNLAYPYDYPREIERPYAEYDYHGSSAYHDTIKAARRRAEYEAEALAAARAELAAEKALRERARAEQLAKAKRAAAIEAYLAQEVARKEEKERQRKAEKERTFYEAAVAAAKEKFIREKRERTIAEFRNRQRQKSFQQALQSADQERSVRFHNQAVPEQAELDSIQQLLQMIGLDQPQSQYQPQSRSQPTALPQARLQPKCEAGQSACHRQQANDVKEHEADLLAHLMSLHQPACQKAKQEVARPAQPHSGTAQPTVPTQPVVQGKAPEQAEVNPLQFLLHLVEAASEKKAESTPNVSSKPEDAPAVPTVPAWHWIPHPSVQNFTTAAATTAEPKPRIDAPSVLTASHEASPVTSATSASAHSAPSSPIQNSTSSRLRLSTLDNRLSSLVDRPTEKALSPSELEYELTRLLLEADGIESDGDESLRGDRKQFVVRVERVLDGLDISSKQFQTPSQSQPQSQPQREESAKDNHDETTDKNDNIDSPTTALSVTEPLPDPTPVNSSTNSIDQLSRMPAGTEKETDHVSGDDSFVQPEISAEVKSDGSGQEIPAVVSSTDSTSADSLSEPSTASPSAPVVDKGITEDLHDAVSDASSEASSPPSSPIITAKSEVTRRDSVGSNSSSSSSIRRGRKAYVEDAAEDGEDEFQLV